jgi:LuxR family maltose regulon positive regulatory protein
LDYVELQIYLDTDPQDVSEIERELERKQESVLNVTPLPKVRALIKQNRAAEALIFLEAELKSARQQSDYIKTWLLILQALGHSQQKHQTAALNSLGQAFELAERENWIILFVREGPAMEKLLRTAQVQALNPAFVQRLLKVCDSRRKPKPAPAPMPQDLIEPLSDRELEVLQHLNSYLSTPEIADLLVVSANTVRTHIKNIYGKLGVHGRSDAVQRARELNLLA